MKRSHQALHFEVLRFKIHRVVSEIQLPESVMAAGSSRTDIKVFTLEQKMNSYIVFPCRAVLGLRN